MIKPKISNVFFMCMGSLITIVTFSLFGFTSRNSREKMFDEEMDTLKIDVPSLRYIELILGDSASELDISIYNAQILSVAHKSKVSMQGVEYDYAADGSLYRKTAFKWFSENDTSLYVNQFFEGDTEFMGQILKNYVYHGDCFLYSRKTKPEYEVKFENGWVVQ